MVINYVLFADLLAIRAHEIATSEVLHHAVFFRVINVLLAVVVKKVAFRLCLHGTTRAFEITFLRVGVLHVLEIIATRSKTFVAFNAEKTLLFVFVNNVHAHCRGFFVMAVETAYGTVDMSTYLFITFYLRGIARSR